MATITDPFALDMIKLFPGAQGTMMASAYLAFAAQHSGSSPVVVQLFAQTPAGAALNKTDPKTGQTFLADILNKSPASQPGPEGGLFPGVSNPLAFLGWLQDIGHWIGVFVSAITDGAMWRSLGWITLGLILMVVGILMLLRKMDVLPDVVPIPV